jgi:hypothetical protein
MRQMIAGIALAAASGVFALVAAAQGEGRPVLTKPVIPKVPIGTAIKGGAAPAGQATLQGCIRHQTYNTQSVNTVSVVFVLITPTGDERINFEADKIRYVPPGAGLPIATAAETQKWSQVLNTIERGAAAGKPLQVMYSTPSNEVFAINVMWSSKCP